MNSVHGWSKVPPQEHTGNVSKPVYFVAKMQMQGTHVSAVIRVLGLQAMCSSWMFTCVSYRSLQAMEFGCKYHVAGCVFGALTSKMLLHRGMARTISALPD